MPAPRAGCRISGAARKANNRSGPGRNPPTRIRVSDIPRFESSETRNEIKCARVRTYFPATTIQDSDCQSRDLGADIPIYIPSDSTKMKTAARQSGGQHALEPSLSNVLIPVFAAVLGKWGKNMAMP